MIKYQKKLKKEIYKAEQELTDNEEFDLIEIIINEREGHPPEYKYTFTWIGYDKELERGAEEMGCTVEQAEEIVERAGHEMMNEILGEFIPLGDNDEIIV
ncbi:hypothetical protein [Methanobrevibacter millerae]|uniref:Uncharacterized protein n=1 Tax=Methanobrevibacter millerae TaxID=230361 RepID=A0A1G5VJ27_9EURY|nr:hypothetical protein [Methanobrevibacter millerae]SDA45065.1 hypothetical protein SAMN02910315_00595 [Methanobrevibacter millerae]